MLMVLGFVGLDQLGGFQLMLMIRDFWALSSKKSMNILANCLYQFKCAISAYEVEVNKRHCSTSVH